jgi:NAD-dependent deacetylase sirtuin 5
VALCDLPRCPDCTSLLRPGVVWFGETLAAGAPDTVDDWLWKKPIDLVIAAGTSLDVFPAAEWVNAVRDCGATLAIIDADKDHWLGNKHELNDGDWFFLGDIAVILPKLLGLLKR